MHVWPVEDEYSLATLYFLNIYSAAIWDALTLNYHGAGNGKCRLMPHPGPDSEQVNRRKPLRT